MITKFNQYKIDDVDEDKISYIINHGFDLDDNTLISIIDSMDDINYQKQRSNITVLHWCIYLNRMSLVKYILKNNADINIQTKKGETPLMWAFDDASIELMILLIKSGSDFNIETKDGKNIIEYAKDYKNRFTDIEESENEFKEKIKILDDPNFPELMNLYIRNKKANEFNL